MALFNSGAFHGDDTDMLANRKKLIIDIFHLPSGTSVQFKAFVTSYQDKFESDYNSEDVYGRMDPIQTFKGTKRKITLGWDVVSFSEDEAKTNLERCTTLFSMLYPTYSEGGTAVATTISAGPIFRLKFANLIQDVSAGSTGGASAASAGLVGTISGFTYEPDFESGFFDAGIGTLLPQTIKLSCEYTVNHTHGLGYSHGTKRTKNFPYNLQGQVGTPDASDTGPTPTTGDTAENKTAAAEMGGGSTTTGGVGTGSAE